MKNPCPSKQRVRQVRSVAAPGGRVRLVMSVVDMVEWAFRSECVQLDMPRIGDVEDQPRGYGLEFVLISRAMLGTQIDGGGRSDPAHDAEVVASIVGNLPAGVGGRRMSVAIAEMAKSGRWPDPMIGVEPRIQPRHWRQTKHGRMAVSEVCGRISYRKGPRAGGRLVTRDVTWCPIEWTPTPQEIASARRYYLLWWSAMLEIRTGLKAAEGLMDRHQVSDVMPPQAPWKTAATQEGGGRPASSA